MITQVSNDYFSSTFNDYFIKSISIVKIGESKNQSTTEFKCEYNHKINNKDLIDFLVREGHLDENYERFISKYNGAHKENQTFLLSLSNRKALDFNYEIKDISALIKDIKGDCFHQKEILNFHLIDYLLENKNEILLDSIFILLKDETENSVSFIDRYLDYTKDINKQYFLNRLIGHWKGVYSFILNETSYLPEKYITLIFKSLIISSIDDVNVDDNLAFSISQMSNLNCINFNDAANRNKVEEFLKNNNVRFDKLIYNQKYKHLIDFIYNNNLYEINFHMIELFVDLYKVNEVDLEDLKTANFTTLLKSGSKKLIEYINKDIFKYVDCLFLDLKDNVEEDENSIVTLLNNEDLSEGICTQVIEKSPAIISDILRIKNKTLWHSLFECNRLEISWKNFFEYYKVEKVLDETLVKYLNNETVFKTLAQTGFSEIDETLKLSFQKDIISSGIDHDSFKAIVKQLPFCYEMDELLEVNETWVKSLIENDLITLEKDNFEALNVRFPNLIILFIKKNKEEFLNIYQELELDSSVIKELLELPEFIKEEKINIIENIDEDKVIADKNLGKGLCVFLQNIEKINISEAVINSLLSSNADEASRVNIFNEYYINLLSLKILDSRIKSLGKPYDVVLGRTHLKIKNTVYNKLFCKNLKGRYIGDPKEEKGMLKAIPKSIKI